jgi:hypothetical protein
MTTSWTKLTTHNEAIRRAGGRRHYNSVRQLDALLRLVEIHRLVGEYGMGHGVRQRIADELGVHRSTISRQLRPYGRAPRATKPSSAGPSTAQWIRALEPLGVTLAAEGCDCEVREEPRHGLSHVLRMVAETLNAVDDGEIEFNQQDRRTLERVKDVLVRMMLTRL